MSDSNKNVLSLREKNIFSLAWGILRQGMTTTAVLADTVSSAAVKASVLTDAGIEVALEATLDSLEASTAAKVRKDLAAKLAATSMFDLPEDDA